MKLKNIIIAICAVAVLVSCEKDNKENISTFPTGEAKISAKVNVKGSPSTALGDDTNELAGEANINSLSVLVFDEEDLYLGAGYETLATSYTVQLDDIIIPAGGVRVALVTNAAEDAFANAATYADFESILLTLGSQTQGNLAMSSQVITTGDPMAVNGQYYVGVAGEDNLGGVSQLWLTRVPARLQLGGVTTTFTGWMENRVVRIDEITYENMKTGARYFSEGDWGAVEASGEGLLTTSAYVPVDAFVSNAAPLTNLSHTVYTMENTDVDAPTMIAVRATLLADEDEAAVTRTFRGIINESGTNPVRVRRNYVYNVSFSFSNGSFGSTEPDPYGALDVQVEVVNWGEVNQVIEGN